MPEVSTTMWLTLSVACTKQKVTRLNSYYNGDISVIVVSRVTFCFVQATDKDNHMVVKTSGIIIQVLASEVLW